MQIRQVYINGNKKISIYSYSEKFEIYYNEIILRKEFEKCMMRNEKKINYKEMFSQTEYLKIVIAAAINRFGDSIDAIASAWIIYELSGNAAWSAIIFGVNKLPSVFITPLAGAWVEGKNKKKIMVVTDIIRAVCVAFVATGYLVGFLQIWMLLATTIIISTVEAFRGPAGTALTPQILDKKYYEYGMSFMSSMSMIVELIGTAVAASIIAFVGTAGAIYVDMITFIMSATIIMTVRCSEKVGEKKKFDGKGYKQTLVDGVKYVNGQKSIKKLLVICVFLNSILVPLDSLQAPIASEILGGSAELLSIFGIAATIGMLLGSICYPILAKKIVPKTLIFVGGELIGVYYIGMVLCKSLYANKFSTMNPFEYRNKFSRHDTTTQMENKKIYCFFVFFACAGLSSEKLIAFWTRFST